MSLQDAKTRPFAEIFRDHLERYFDQLERESLLRKIDVLYGICQPEPGVETVRGYRFDRDHLSRLDTLRHEIIHGVAFGKPIAGIEEELFYMLDTATHLMILVALRFGLKLAGEHVKNYFYLKLNRSGE